MMDKIEAQNWEKHYQFRSDIELMDETLREGAERSPINIALADKLEVAQAIVEIGVTSLVIGMFPDVPDNIELLKSLLMLQQNGSISSDVRFYVISHVGETYRRTLETLNCLGQPLNSVWIILIHSMSDSQILHLFPSILQRDKNLDWDQKAWESISEDARRERNLTWLKQFLSQTEKFSGAGVMAGLLDTFRSDPHHVNNAITIFKDYGIEKIRLVDTAGTATPQQVQQLIPDLINKNKELKFYGHFHNDFGLATANAVLGLSLGLAGIDISVGGFANRAGHPALAEVVMSLHELYKLDLPIHIEKLCLISRHVERAYGLLESPTQAITGVITHSIVSGIRTEIQRKCPQIFDVIDAEKVGAQLLKAFGARSGYEGILQFLERHEDQLSKVNINADEATARLVQRKINEAWKHRSEHAKKEIRKVISMYHQLLQSALITEQEILEFLVEDTTLEA